MSEHCMPLEKINSNINEYVNYNCNTICIDGNKITATCKITTTSLQVYTVLKQYSSLYST